MSQHEVSRKLGTRSALADLARGVLGGLLVLAIVEAMSVRLGMSAGISMHAHGPGAWISSRAAAVVAYIALALDAIFGLFLSSGAGDRLLARARSMELHRWLSGIAIGMAALHAVALLFDATVRFDVLDVLVPFASAYRPVAVGLGVLALYAMFVVRESFAWRARLGTRVWKKLHMLAFVAFAMATAHGLFAGSDTERPWMRAIYISAVACVGFLTARRYANRPSAPTPRAARARR